MLWHTLHTLGIGLGKLDVLFFCGLRKGLYKAFLGVDQVVLDIDSALNVNTYIASSATTQAQILAIGDVNSGPTNVSGRVNNITFIAGSFLDISP